MSLLLLLLLLRESAWFANWRGDGEYQATGDKINQNDVGQWHDGKASRHISTAKTAEDPTIYASSYVAYDFKYAISKHLSVSTSIA